jgi:hypothetical protein
MSPERTLGRHQVKTDPLRVAPSFNEMEKSLSIDGEFVHCGNGIDACRRAAQGEEESETFSI